MSEDMKVPGYGVYRVLRVYRPDESLPVNDGPEPRRYLVGKDGTCYQVALDAQPLPGSEPA